VAAIGVRELKAKAAEILRRAEQGERIVLTRRGRPVAAIVAIEDPDKAYDRALEAVSGRWIKAAEADLAGGRTVTKWRKRFFEERMPGLEERERSGRTPVFPPRAGGGGKGHRL